MATCEICGTDFDDHGVQIVLPGLAKSFDRIDCAVRARNLAGVGAAGVPLRGTLIDLTGSGKGRSFVLGGLSAGLAAALAGTRTRLAVGGATAGVALLVATTAHLATRGGDADTATRAQALAPPARYASDFADRTRAVTVADRTARRRSRGQASEPSKVTFALLTANRSTAVGSTAPSASPKPHPPQQSPPGQKPKPPSSEPPSSGGKPPTGGKPSSTRPGWGHGDDKHEHTGPQGSKSGSDDRHDHGNKHGKHNDDD
jgi:hypothetical protein